MTAKRTRRSPPRWGDRGFERHAGNALLVSLALGLLAGAAWMLPASAEPVTPAGQSGGAPEDQPASFETEKAAPPRNVYLAEIVDSLFYVGPAEFLALDLPANPAGARAIHLYGTVSVADRKGDIMIRLFRESEYQNWLKKRGGDKSAPYWTSKRSRTHTLDQDLPPNTRVVLLLDNGYSVRTPKRVRTQLQVQYERTDGSVVPATTATTQSVREDDFITPRDNSEEDVPPPPPPPPPSE